MRILIDTDIGDDIDDILTIAWALEKNVDLVGVTTVYREAKDRLAIVDNLLSIAGRTDIPTLEGYSKSMTDHARKLGKFNYKSDEEVEGNNPDKAIDFILESVKKYDDLVVLAIGAQTNVAQACLREPETMKNANLVIMGGSFFTHTDEWNIACDPIAAKTVLDTCDNITYIPWDITRHICIGPENYKAILEIKEDSLRGRIASYVESWSKRNTYIPLLHDPAALYYCLHPECFKMQKTLTKIVTEGDCMGMTLNLEYLRGGIQGRTEHRKVNLAEEADSGRIVAEFMKDVFKL